MKNLMRILGILLLLGGLGLVGLFLTGDAVSDAERYVSEEKARTEKAKTEMEFSQSPEAKANYETRKKMLNNNEGLLIERKQNRNFGVIGGVVLSILGIGLFGVSFIFGKKN